MSWQPPFPVFPIEHGVYQVIYPPDYTTSGWERHINLRIIPTTGYVAGLLASAWGVHPIGVLTLLLLPAFIAVQIWPLSGGPCIPLYRRPTSPPKGAEQ